MGGCVGEIPGRTSALVLGSRGTGGRGGPGYRVGMKGQEGALSIRQDREPPGTMGVRAKGGGLRTRLHTSLGTCPPAWQEREVRVAVGTRH